MADFNDDIYGDLDQISKDIETQKLLKDFTELQNQNNSLSRELDEVKQQLRQIAEDKFRIEGNLQTLFQTAKTEITRKDKELIELREKVVSLKRR